MADEPEILEMVIATLRCHEAELRARGICHAAVFGSVARGDNRPDSDLDILVEFEPGAEGTIYEYMNLKEYVAGLFDGSVDVVDRDALKPHVRAPSARDAVYAKKESGALADMLHHIHLAEQFARGRRFEDLRDDQMPLYAIARCLEIISEASWRLSDELKARHP
jgi:predicted nucleotidyltransferase